MDVLLSGDVISYTISYLEDFRDVLALLQVSRTMRDQVCAVHSLQFICISGLLSVTF